MKIAVLGPKGTFSDKAYIEYDKCYMENNTDAKPLEPIYFPTIDDVFDAVSVDNADAKDENIDSDIEKCEIGIVPIENTLDGFVMRTLDLLLEKNIYLRDENMVEVQFSAIANVDKKEDIEKLYVQFKAHGQCRKFIKSLGNIKISTTESNMESFHNIKDNKGEAAIVPKHVADAQEDKFKIDNVTDSKSNFTRFVVIRPGKFDGKKMASKRKKMDSDEEITRVRIPLYIMPKKDRPGILFEILRYFYEDDINLISLMSRPTKQELGTYNFYMEIDDEYERIDTILETIKKIKKDNDIKILGIYSKE